MIEEQKDDKHSVRPNSGNTNVLRRLRAVYRLVRFNSRYRMIIRNHWTGQFNGSFLLKIGVEKQGWDLTVWQFGLFNFALCLLHDSSAE